jgi:hypothetical protein
VSDVANEAKVVIGELKKPGRIDADDSVVQGEDSSGQTESPLDLQDHLSRERFGHPFNGKNYVKHRPP